MKIIVSANGFIWDGNHPALRRFGEDVILFLHQSPEELLEAVGEDRDILILTDNDPASFYPFQILASSFRSRRIHLFSCLPFSYESSRKKQEIRELLQDMSMVKSLCLLELDSFLRDTDLTEKLDHLQARIREEVTEILLRAIPVLQADTDEFSQYLYDASGSSYRRTDLTDMESLLSQIPALRRKRPEVPASAQRKDPAIPGISPEIPGEMTEQGMSRKPEVSEEAATTAPEDLFDDISIEPEEISGNRASGMKAEEKSTEKEAAAKERPEAAGTAAGALLRKEQSPEEAEQTTESTQEKRRRSLFGFLKRKKA